MKRTPYTWTVISLTLFFGCQSSPHNIDAGNASHSSDSRFLDNSVSDGDSDLDTTEQSPLFQDTSRWLDEQQCEGTVQYPAVDEAFAIPDRPGEPPQAMRTAPEVLASLGSSADFAHAMIPEETLNPGSEWGYDLYSEDGDVAIYVYIVTGLEQSSLETYRKNVSVLVDYQPVNAKLTQWNADRTTKLDERIGSGINVSFSSNVTIVDVVIPSEQFSEDRAYEISISYEANTFESRPFGASRRFILYRNGYTRPDRPCAVPSLNERIAGHERQLSARIATNNALLFTDDVTEYEDVDVVHEVRPGETKRFYTTFMSFGRPHAGLAYFVPIIDGEPVDGQKGWYVKQPARDGEDTGRLFVDGRASFEMTMPEQPGLYDVQIVSWLDPFEIWRTREGGVVDGVRNAENSVNSNVLRFRVAEP